MSQESTTIIDGVTVIKSARRKRTYSWRWVDGALEMRAPLRATKKDIQAAIAIAKQRAATPRRSLARDDERLRAEAEALNRTYFHGALTIGSIRYAEMTTRHGSCSTGAGTIRISRQLADAPAWVRLSVVHHELCHLLEPGHGPAFHELAARYPYTQQANDYLRLLERLPRSALTALDSSGTE